MSEREALRDVNGLLDKFGLHVSKLHNCSTFVRSWAAALKDRNGLQMILQNVMGLCQSQIAGVDNLIAAQGALMPEHEQAFYRSQQAVFQRAQRNLAASDASVREMYEMLVAGAHMVYSGLPAEAQRQMRQPQLSIARELPTSTGTPNPAETELFARRKFVQKSRTLPDGSLEPFIFFHPNAVISWAATKETQKTKPAEEARQALAETIHYYIRAGAEEYYHAYQASYAPKREELHQACIRHYGTVDYERVRSQMHAEMAQLQVTDLDEFHRRSQEFAKQDPIERDADDFLKAREAKLQAMATAFQAACGRKK